MTCQPTTTLVLLPTLLCPGSSKLALPPLRITGLAAVCSTLLPQKGGGSLTLHTEGGNANIPIQTVTIGFMKKSA